MDLKSLDYGAFFLFGIVNISLDNANVSPIRRGVTTGLVDLRPDHDVYFAVLPVEVYNPSTHGSDWVITVLPFDDFLEQQGGFDRYVRTWKSYRDFAVYKNDGIRGDPSPFYADPLVAKSFELYPDLQQRIIDFSNTKIAFPLNQPGIILETVALR